MGRDGSPLVRFIEQTFGGNYFVDTTVVNVATTTTKLVANNYDRLGLIMTNTGANDIYLYPGVLPGAGQGIRVAANGGVVSFQAKDDLVLVGYDWSGVTTSGVSSLLAIEIKQY